MTTRDENPVYRPLNQIDTILGAERRLFRKAALLSALVFALFHTIVGGVVMFLVLLAGARRITRADPKLIEVLQSTLRYRSQYDPGKRADVLLALVDHDPQPQEGRAPVHAHA